MAPGDRHVRKHVLSAFRGCEPELVVRRLPQPARRGDEQRFRSRCLNGCSRLRVQGIQSRAGDRGWRTVDRFGLSASVAVLPVRTCSLAVPNIGSISIIDSLCRWPPKRSVHEADGSGNDAITSLFPAARRRERKHTYAPGTHRAGRDGFDLVRTLRGTARAQNGGEQAAAEDLTESILGAQVEFRDGKVIVTHVKRGGTADRAGVRPGDQLQSIEKHVVGSPDDVTKVLEHFKPGDGIVLTVVPKASARQLYLAPPVKKPSNPLAGTAMLGVTLSDSSGSVVAGQLSMGGPAIVAGLRSGDKIVAVDGSPIAAKDQLLKIVSASSPGDRIDLTIQRDGWRRTLPVRLGAVARCRCWRK